MDTDQTPTPAPAVTADRVKRPRYVVYLQHEDGSTTEHQVTVTVQDRLRAEQMAAQLGLPGISDAQQTHVALWCWAALRRTNDTEAKAAHFLNVQLLDFDQVKGSDDVGPTEQAATPA